MSYDTLHGLAIHIERRLLPTILAHLHIHQLPLVLSIQLDIDILSMSDGKNFSRKHSAYKWRLEEQTGHNATLLLKRIVLFKRLEACQWRLTESPCLD